MSLHISSDRTVAKQAPPQRPARFHMHVTTSPMGEGRILKNGTAELNNPTARAGETDFLCHNSLN